MNQTPPPPLVHERRPRGSRRCTELELNVAVVHGTSRNPITKRAVVHETRLLRGFANRTAGRAFRCAAAEEPTELSPNIFSVRPKIFTAWPAEGHMTLFVLYSIQQLVHESLHL